MSLNYYIKFSENDIFEDPNLNVFFNQLFTFLGNNLEPVFVQENLVIDKQIALILQDESASLVPAVHFVTSQRSIFELLRTSASALAINAFHREGDVITFTAFSMQVVFTLLPELPAIVDYTGIKLVEKTAISTE